MAELADFLRHQDQPPQPIPQRRTLVLFYTAPNLTTSTIKINDPTKDLLELCDGEHTTQSLLTTLARLHGLREDESGDGFRRSVISILGNLYEKGIIIFC